METKLVIKRDYYLQKLLNARGSSPIKIVTGIRRCGKSFLLNRLFVESLLQEGLNERKIIYYDLEGYEPDGLPSSDDLEKEIRSKILDASYHVLIIDEIQRINHFEFLLMRLNKIPNLDIYVTGSNSRFLSSDIITEFRGRSLNIRIHPLSFKEILDSGIVDSESLLDTYLVYGGMPGVFDYESPAEKEDYLKDLFDTIYLKDIVNRYHIRKKGELDDILTFLASSVGSLVSPKRIADTLSSENRPITSPSVERYVSYLLDAFVVSKASRRDVRGKRIFKTPSKFFFEDVGLRNAKNEFRPGDIGHLMENVVYSELCRRGYRVEVGMVRAKDNGKLSTFEIDFVADKADKRLYVQVANDLMGKETMDRETRPFSRIYDSYPKRVVSRSVLRSSMTEEGILFQSLRDFLLDGSY